MAGVLGHEVVAAAQSGVKSIKGRAQAIRAATTMPFDQVSQYCAGIRNSDFFELKPITDGPQAATNTIINRFVVAGWPADSWGAIDAIRDALLLFYPVAKPIVEGTAGGSPSWPMTFDNQGATVWATVNVTDMHATLNTVIAACQVLEPG